MNKLLILSAQYDFTFPLAEAVRKQIWNEALVNKEFDRIEIWIITPSINKILFKDSIRIKQISKINFIRKCFSINQFQTLSYIGNVGFFSMLAGVIFRNKKNITIADGGVYSINKTFFIKLLTPFFHFFYDNFYVYTAHQKKILLSSSKCFSRRLFFKKPILNDVKKFNKKNEKRNKFRILYMSYLSKNKGAEILINNIEFLIAKYPKIEFVFAIAHPNLNDQSLSQQLDILKSKYKKNIFILGKVDPQEELFQADLYYYCFKKHEGTFAFPLSLYESIQSNTIFIGPKLDGVAEFFDNRFLCDPYNIKDIRKKISDMIQQHSLYLELLESNKLSLNSKITLI
jgi:glycosyltransferase involved in cell wall biosynthesis